MKAYCTVCLEEAECRHFDLYTIGSEGTWLCHRCEMAVVEFIRQMMRDLFLEKRNEYLKKHQGELTGGWEAK